MKKAALFAAVLLASALVATWAARFSAELSGLTPEQWGTGGFLLALVNWAIVLILCPLLFFLLAKKSDLYAASAAGVVIPPAVGFAVCMLLLKFGQA